MPQPINTICNWLDEHIDGFRYAPGAVGDSFTQVKPLGELILVLYSFSTPSCKEAMPALYRWAIAKGHVLQPWVEDFGNDIDWEKMPGQFINKPVSASAIFMFRAITALTGKPTKWDDCVQSVFSAAELPEDTGNTGVLFAADICGFGNCHDNAVRLLFELLASENALLFSSLYMATHYIFYATKMGARPICISATQQRTLENFLQRALVIAIAKKYYDLTGELLMCMNWMRAYDCPEYDYGLQMLSEVTTKHGYVPNTTGRRPEIVNGFNANYHSSLITLAAMGHAHAVCRSINT